MPDKDPLPQILHLLDVAATQFGDLTGRVDGLSNRVDSLTVEMRTGFSGVNRRLDRLKTRVEGIETEFGAYRRENDQRIAAIESNFN